MYSENYQIDFIRRTLAMIKEENLLSHTNYEVTLLINLMIGLIFVDDLFVDEKENFSKLFANKYLYFQDLYGFDKKMSSGEDLWKQVHAIRNAVAHHRFRCIEHKRNDTIAAVEFHDTKKGKEHFRITFTVENLYEFVTTIGELVLEYTELKNSEQN